MKLCRLPGQDEASKFLGMVQAIPDIWTGAVLDVGCRTGALRRVLVEQNRSRISYVGVDLRPPASALANLEHGLPFSDQTFNVVVALDVLEHTDNIHAAFAELCRVSKTFVLILLPNAVEISSRIRFLRGKPLNGKYGLPISPPEDRHRWMFSLTEAQAFVHHLAPKWGFITYSEGCVAGPRRAGVIGRRLCAAWPNLLSSWYLALLKRRTPLM